ILVIAKLFIVYFLYAMMLLNYYILKYRDNLIRKEQSEEKLKNLLQEAELNLLKSQLNPHFIFNSLNSINSLSVTDPSKARDMVVKLSTFLRYSLGKHTDEMVQVSEELESVRLFIDIEKTRFGKRLNVEEKIDPNCLKRNIPLMILQPLLENAIKFGVYEQLGDVKIKLEVNELENGFEVVIENNYDPGETDSKGKGIGLRNVQKRLEILYGKNHGFYVESKDNIFRVRIIFKEK
ncbi:MAG: histidine kinase, partial [Cyclobacteriaceae bacterium]|nr:histidine kinase [Cyclobacteriaceae bacterium]